MIRLMYLWRGSRSRSIVTRKCLHDSSNLVGRQALLDQLLDKSHLQSSCIGTACWHRRSGGCHAIYQASGSILCAKVGK